MALAYTHPELVNAGPKFSGPWHELGLYNKILLTIVLKDVVGAGSGPLQAMFGFYLEISSDGKDAGASPWPENAESILLHTGDLEGENYTNILLEMPPGSFRLTKSLGSNVVSGAFRYQFSARVG